MANRNDRTDSDKAVRDELHAVRGDARDVRRPGSIQSGGPTLKKQLRYELRRRSWLQP